MNTLSDHYPTGCWVQPNGEYAGECTCGHTFVGSSYALAKVAWAEHASSPHAPEIGEIVAWRERDGDEWAYYDADSKTGRHIAAHQRKWHNVKVFPLYGAPLPDAAGSGGEAREAIARIDRGASEALGEMVWTDMPAKSLRAESDATQTREAELRTALQEAWSASPTLPPIVFSDAEADALIAALNGRAGA